MNLLQPQDRRSLAAGDAKETVAARRRTLERGLGDAILTALRRRVHGEVLDLGCGEGFFLGQLASAQTATISGWGVDLSVPAIDAAARRWPRARWIVANADRSLPFAAGGFDVVLSITGRKNGPEMRRLLRAEGRAVVVVSAEDDLAELRAILHGQATEKDRRSRTIEDFRGVLALVDEETVRTRVTLDRAGIDDVLAGTYRGARRAQRDRLAAHLAEASARCEPTRARSVAGDTETLTVTSSHRMLVFAPVR